MMKKNCSILMFAGLLILAACSKLDNPQGLSDVQFEVPASVTLEAGAKTLGFTVLNGKAPQRTDVLLLAGLPGQKVCSIASVSEERFEINLGDGGLAEGSWTVSIQRGAQVERRGTMQVVLAGSSDGVEPAAGSTVYGKVFCEGRGVPDVVVSDGYEVVVTDADGVYQMASKKYHKYVFISVPSGYVADRNGILPVLHKQLTRRATAAERVDFSLSRVDGQDNYTLLVFGDIHLAARNNDRAQFASFVSDVNAYTASHAQERIYGLTLGDMTWDQYWLTNNYSFKEYLADAGALTGLSVYHTIGNHDHSMYYAGDYDTVVEYKAAIAPTYYSFNIGGVHYVVLDDIECTNSGEGTAASRDYNSNIVEDQIEWLRKDLAYVPKTTPLVISMHAPLYKNPQYSTGGSGFNLKAGTAAQLEAAVKGYVKVHVFTGHTHKMYNVDNLATSALYEHNAGAVCATWWWSAKETPGIHIAQDGAPGGYSIVKVSGGEFSWQFKATGAPVEHQFRTYDRNQIEMTPEKWTPSADDAHKALLNNYNAAWKAASSSNYVYLNVWNYDTSWKVEVFEDGRSLPVVRTIAMDPLHILAYTASRLNGNNGVTFGTSNTYHMFRAQASGPDTTLEIRVTDRFGNVYTETMTRPKPFTAATYRF